MHSSRGRSRLLPADHDKPGPDQTLLSIAAEAGDEAKVTLLLATTGVDADSKSNGGRTALSYAAENGHLAVVKLLLKSPDVDPNSKTLYGTCSGRTPLSYAALRGHIDIVQLLLKTDRIIVDSRRYGGRTPLSDAAEMGHFEIVQLLLDHGADSSSTNVHERCALLYAAAAGHKAVVGLLLKQQRVGLGADSSGDRGTAVILFAATHGNEDIVRVLLEVDGILPDSENAARSREGRTPLSYAAESGHQTIVNLLLSVKGVIRDHKGVDGRTPLSFAAEKGHAEVVNLLLSAQNVDPNSQGEDGQTPLSLAAWRGHDIVVECLLALDGMDKDAKDRNGRTALSLAAEAGHQNVVSQLLAVADIDRDSKDCQGRTPLSYAQHANHKAVATLLLDAGADPNCTWNEEGKTQSHTLQKMVKPKVQPFSSKDTKGEEVSTREGDSSSLRGASAASIPLRPMLSNHPAATQTARISPSGISAITDSTQESFFREWDSLAPLSTKIDHDTIKGVLANTLSPTSDSGGLTATDTASPNFYSPSRFNMQHYVEMSNSVDHPVPEPIILSTTHRKTLLKWVSLFKTPRLSEQLEEFLSPRQVISLRVLQEWYQGSFQPIPFIIATQRHIIHLATTTGRRSSDNGESFHQFSLQDSFYHKACYDLFMTELCPPADEDNNAAARLRFVANLERLRDVAIEQTKAQRIAYETFVYLESRFHNLDPSEVRWRNIYEAPPIDMTYLDDRLRRFAQASYDMRWYRNDKKSKGLEKTSTSSWTKTPSNLKGTATRCHRSPRYLWNIQKRCTVTVARPCPPYTCISHTWGRWRSNSPSVTIANVPWKVPQNTIYDVRELPEILARQKWDTDYLWFDLFTIPQEDRSKTTPLSREEEELQKIAEEEIAHQTDIFQGSTACIAWMNHVSGDLSSLQCAVDWLCLQHLRLSSRYNPHALAGGTFVNWCDWLLHKPVTELDNFVSKALYEVGNLELLDREIDKPTPWFSSLWTLQELHLCPEMILVTKDWKPLWNPTGTSTTVAEIIALLNSVIRNDVNSTANGVISFGSLSRPRHSKFTLPRGTDCGDVGRGDQGMMHGWPNQARELLEFFQRVKLRNASPRDKTGIVGILLEANTREVSARRLVARAQAIMSAVGCTRWYQKKDQVSKEGLVLGAYPLPFVQEVVEKVGAAFFLTISSVRVEWWNQKDPIGTMLPFAPPGSTRVRNTYNLQPLPALGQDHSSLSQWEIQIDGAVKITQAAILTSNFDPADDTGIVVDIIISRDDEHRGVTKDVLLRRYLKDDLVQFVVVLSEGPAGRVGLWLQQVGHHKIADSHAHLKLYKRGLISQSYGQRGFQIGAVSTDVDWLVI